ncbi:RNA polymerase sigma factor [Georgenia thermotolerans]|uniref:RNA polymerase sigma factor n=1 Tax=Georgenia thermotolerans TaxID=527326 RepID=UPI001B8B0080|nr:sigma-70 family RNA polymerase sigma factor [Georgenia thermotolerans]
MPNDRQLRFRDLYARTRDDVLRFAKRRVHPSHAEDVVAEVYLVAWRRLEDAPRLAGPQRAWLFGIARRCLLNAYRADGRRAALAVRLAAAGEVAHAVAADHDGVHQRIDLARAWRRLGAEDQEVLALTVFDDLTSTEAAQVLGITPPAYRVRLMRARRRLRQHLDHPAQPTDDIADPAPTARAGGAIAPRAKETTP